MDIRIKSNTFYQGKSYKAGEVHAVDDSTAKRWILHGIAESAEEIRKRKAREAEE